MVLVVVSFGRMQYILLWSFPFLKYSIFCFLDILCSIRCLAEKEKRKEELKKIAAREAFNDLDKDQNGL